MANLERQLKVGYSPDAGPFFPHWCDTLPENKTNGILINVFAKEKSIGYLEVEILKEDQESKFFIGNITTTPTRSGNGTLMLEKIEELAPKFGIHTIEGLVMQNNLSAIFFFKKHGFTMEEYYGNKMKQYKIFKSLTYKTKD